MEPRPCSRPHREKRRARRRIAAIAAVLSVVGALVCTSRGAERRRCLLACQEEASRACNHLYLTATPTPKAQLDACTNGAESHRADCQIACEKAR